MSVSQAQSNLADLVKRASEDKERIIITEQGKDLAAVVPIEDVRLLEELEDRVDLEDARKALEEAEREGTIPLEQVKRELGL